MAKIRQEINIINVLVTTGSSNARVQLDTTQYSGTVKYYFETVAKVASGTLTCNLQRVSGANNDATTTTTETSYTRHRSTAFTPPAGQTAYLLNLSGGTTPNVIIARIIVIQYSDNSLLNTEAQFEIGNNETGKTNTTAAALLSPKYWLYTAANWNGTLSCFAEVVYATSSTNTATITLQEDDGSFGTWTDKVTIVNAVSNTTPTRTRVSFTPTDGKHYRLSGKTSTTKSNFSIYGGKIIVDQTGQAGSQQGSEKATSSGSTSTSKAFASNPVAGELIAVAIAYHQGSVLRVTDNFGNAYYQIGSPRAANSTLDFIDMWRAPNIGTDGTALTVTVTFSQNTKNSITIFRVQGVMYALGKDLDAINANNGTGTSITTNNVSVTGDWILVATTDDDPNNDSYTANSPWNGQQNNSDPSVGMRIGTETQTNVANGTYNGSFTIATSSNWAARIAAFNYVGITNTEGQQLLLNTKSTATGLQSYKNLYNENNNGVEIQDTHDYAGVTNTYKHAQDTIGSTANAKLQDTDNSNTDVTNSSITGANEQISSALTMPTTTNHQLDTNIVTVGTEVDASKIIVLTSIGNAANYSISDSVTTSENVKMMLDENPSINDSTTTSEFVDVLRNKTRDVGIIIESPSTSENLSILDILNISVNDSTTTSESVLLYYPPQVFDSVVTSESTLLYYPPQVNDSTTTSESVSRMMDVNPNIFDSATSITENVKTMVDESISISDQTIPSESITIDLIPLISVNDSSTVSESVLLYYPPQVFDTTTASESVLLYYPPQVSDATSTSESVTVDVINMPSVNDTSTTSESAVMDLLNMPVVNDSLTVSESITIIPTLGDISVNDSTTTFEAIFITIVDTELIVDAVTTSESVQMGTDNFTNVNDSTTTSESVTVTVITGTGGISVVDSVTTSEAITVIPTLGDISVNDATTTSENAVVDLIPQISTKDTTNTSENLTIDLINMPSVNDSTTTSESVSAYENENINISDITTISEAVTLIPSIGNINVFDATTTSESIVMGEADLSNIVETITTSEQITIDLIDLLSVNDQTTTSENIKVLLVDLISVSDTSSTSESITIIPTLGNISVSELVVLSENIIISAGVGLINVSGADSLTVNESVTILLTGNIHTSDSETISEQLTIFTDLRINTSDTTTASEASIVIQSIGNISTFDAAATSELISARLQNNISASETVLALENVVIDSIEGKLVFDATTTSESVALQLNPIELIAFDSSITGEFVLIKRVFAFIHRPQSGLSSQPDAPTMPAIALKPAITEPMGGKTSGSSAIMPPAVSIRPAVTSPSSARTYP